MAIFYQTVADILGDGTGYLGGVDAGYVCIDALPLCDPGLLGVRDGDEALEDGRRAAVECVGIATNLEEGAVRAALASKSLLIESG
jgi:hypothetical protein